MCTEYYAKRIANKTNGLVDVLFFLIPINVVEVKWNLENAFHTNLGSLLILKVVINVY